MIAARETLIKSQNQRFPNNQWSVISSQELESETHLLYSLTVSSSAIAIRFLAFARNDESYAMLFLNLRRYMNCAAHLHSSLLTFLLTDY